MPKGLFDDQSIDIPCPQCKAKVTARIAQLKRQPTLKCRAGHSFDVDAKELVRKLEQAEKALSNLGKNFKF